MQRPRGFLASPDSLAPRSEPALLPQQRLAKTEVGTTTFPPEGPCGLNGDRDRPQARSRSSQSPTRPWTHGAQTWSELRNCFVRLSTTICRPCCRLSHPPSGCTITNVSRRWPSPPPFFTALLYDSLMYKLTNIPLPPPFRLFVPRLVNGTHDVFPTFGRLCGTFLHCTADWMDRSKQTRRSAAYYVWHRAVWRTQHHPHMGLGDYGAPRS